MTRTFTAVLAAAAVTALASAAPALGATPVVVGQAPLGGTPDIAVDEAGRGHFAWEDSSPAPEVVRYCQLPRGGAACENAEAFGGSPGSVTGRAHVFLSGASGVNVFYQRCCGEPTEGTYLAQSMDGGLNFAAPDRIGDPGVGVNADEAVYGPSNSVSLLAEVITAGTTVQNSDFSGENGAQADLSDTSSGEGAIALQADGRPVVVYQKQTDPNWQFVWRSYQGAVIDEVQLNDPANWSAEGSIAGERVNAADGPALASGPNGLFLFWKQNLPDQGWVQKWTGSGWTTPVQITDGRPFNDIDLHQDATGRLHAVWNAYTDQELRYSWSDDGVTWAPPVDIARGESYPQVRVAAAGDHQGFAVWNRGGPDVVAVSLEALPEPPAGGGGGGGGGADTTDPAVSGFAIGDRTLRPGAGTTFSFSTSEAGRAVLSFHKRVKGLKVRQRGRRRCVPQTRARLRRLRRSAGSRAAYRRLLRQRRCKAWKRVGVIRREVLAGRNEIVWNGRVAGRRLSPGLYQARLVIRDAAGNASHTERLRFRVRRRR